MSTENPKAIIDEKIKHEFEIAQITSMVAEGISILRKENQVDRQTLSEEIKRRIEEPYLSSFGMENVMKVITLAARTGDLKVEDMEYLSKPFVLATHEGFVFQNSNIAAFVTSCDFLTKMVAAGAPIEGIKSPREKVKGAFSFGLAKLVHKVRGL